MSGWNSVVFNKDLLFIYKPDKFNAAPLFILAYLWNFY